MAKFTEKRGKERERKRIKVRFFDGKTGNDKIGFAKNMSPNGMFIESNKVPERGLELTVLVEFPEICATIMGVVRWQKKVSWDLRTVEKPGFGLEITTATQEWYDFFQGPDIDLPGGKVPSARGA